MKKITLTLLASFIASIGMVSAQDFRSASKVSNAPSNPERSVQIPAAYLTSTNYCVGENVSGVNMNLARQVDPSLRIPYTGTYYTPTANAINALVYDNGPHINMPGTPDVSLLESTTLGMTSLGSGAQKSANNHMADDFTIAEEFDITSIDVYAYQTGSTPPSVNAIYLRVWDADPSGGGAVVWGDMTTNIMSAVVFENAYRASESSPTDTSRAIQKVTANTTGLTLDAGTYWIEYTLAGTGGSGPWAPPIAILGQSTTGNALQFLGSSSTWAPVIDSGSNTPQGLPFQVYGTATGGGGGGNACSEENPNDFTFENGFNTSSATAFRVANDITVPADEDFTLTNITASIFANGGISNVDVVYYQDASGLPGTQIGSENSVTIDSQTVIGTNFGFNVNEVKLSVAPFIFNGQAGATKKYWISLKVTDGGSTGSVFWLVTSSSMVGSPSAQLDGVWGIPDTAMDGVYIWEGECTPMGGGGPFPDPYCGPLSFTYVEPITNVMIADISNRSDAAIDGSPAHEDFTSVSGEMEKGETYEITLEGNTNGNYTTRFVVFIDWNQNGILDDAGEVYVIDEPLVNSTGEDGKQITGNIEVPAGALLGSTRMRVKKTFNSAQIDPCTNGSSFGQAEDYTVVVTDGGGGGPFPDPYCGPLNYSSVEPITNVEIAGIANRSDAATGGTNSHEDFTAISGNMTQGETYEITLEGNTDGNFTNRFVIFIDWNQNGILDDAGEVYVIAQELRNSTGTDGKQIFGDIVVPANAVLGNTRMRVKKNFSSARLDPCVAEGAFGQAEDYTINVEEGLGISDVNSLAGFSFYPNPSTDIINLSANQKIESVALYNLLGQQVFASNVGATSSYINVSHLSAGTYVMKVSIDGQVGTYKLLKN